MQTIARAGSEGSEQQLLTVGKACPANDGGSTQVGADTSQGKPTSQGKQPVQPDWNTQGGEISAGRRVETPWLCQGSNTIFLEDLHGFQLSLEKPLRVAYRALEGIDDDLRHAIATSLDQVAELTQATAVVIQSHRLSANQMLSDVLPNFQHPLWTYGANVPVSQLAVLKKMMRKMTDDAKVVRSNYLNVMEHVQYLAICTQVVLDYCDCNDVPEDEYAPTMLKSALHEMKHVQSIMADPADFWLCFHMAELEMGRVESSINNINKMCQAGYPSDHILQSCQCIRVALEQLSLQYLSPCSGSQC